MTDTLLSRAPAWVQPCSLVRYHAPRPVVTQNHHSKPVFLQDRLYGRIVYAPDTWVCGTCHDTIHAWLYWLLGERAEPVGVGRKARQAAQATFEWYLSEALRLGRSDLIPKA